MESIPHFEMCSIPSPDFLPFLSRRPQNQNGVDLDRNQIQGDFNPVFTRYVTTNISWLYPPHGGYTSTVLGEGGGGRLPVSNYDQRDGFIFLYIRRAHVLNKYCAVYVANSAEFALGGILMPTRLRRSLCSLCRFHWVCSCLLSWRVYCAPGLTDPKFKEMLKEC